MPASEFHSAIVAPRGTWWKPPGAPEGTWVAVAFLWGLVLFAMMPFWHVRGGPNPSGIRHRVVPSDYVERVDRFIADYKVGEEGGLAIVAPPPGADIYLLGRMWMWYPALRLQKGVGYTLHLSSQDLNHGFSLAPANLNLQVVPGYDYALRIVPSQAGDFRIVCNEYCGAGHHSMVGKVVVVEGGEGP